MLSLVIALHNEEKRFPLNFPKIWEFLQQHGEPWEIILVDDGSTDGTYQMSQALAQTHSQVRVLRLKKNLGQGAAVKLGVLSSQGDIIFYSDADLSVPLKYAALLIEIIKAGADIAIASRWMRDSQIKTPQPPARKFFGRIYYRLIHGLLLPDIHDTNCGLKAYRGKPARIFFGYIRSWRWAFNVESLWLARRMGIQIVEVPVEWAHRNDSKVHVFRDCIFTLWELFNIKLRQILGVYPSIETDDFRTGVVQLPDVNHLAKMPSSAPFVSKE